MQTLILVIIGFCVGYVLGQIFYETSKKVDGKQEVDTYMTNNYGEDWWKINQSGGGIRRYQNYSEIVYMRKLFGVLQV